MLYIIKRKYYGIIKKIFEDNIYHEIRNVRRNTSTSRVATLCPEVYGKLQKKVHIIISGDILVNVRNEIDNNIVESRRINLEKRKEFRRQVALLRKDYGLSPENLCIPASMHEEIEKIHKQIFDYK